MADSLDAAPRPSFLDRTVDLRAVSWATVAWVVAIGVGVALRFAQLDEWALGQAEAHYAFDAFSLYRGNTGGLDVDLPNTAPLFLVLQAFGFFLFGATDATARLMPALLGLALVLLTTGLRPFVGKPAALGMGVLAAFSPTLVYASRTADPEIAVACFAMLLVVAVLRAGLPEMGDAGTRRWALTAGIALGALFASGPSSISVLAALAAGAGVAAIFDVERQGAVRRGVLAIARSREAALIALAGLVVTVVTLFTRLFSDLGAIAGVGETVADWARLLATGTNPTGTPPQFFLLAILLYEVLALAFAVVALYRDRLDRPGGLSWTFFAVWFGAALLLFTFSTGRTPAHAIHVALPLILLGGGALGDLIASLDWRDTLRGRGGMLALALVGLVIAVFSFAVLAGRIDDAQDEGAAAFQTVVVGALVIVPLAFAAAAMIRAERLEGRLAQPAAIGLLVLALILGAFTFRSSIMLGFFNADEGTELLAMRTATDGVKPTVDRLLRLARDATVTRANERDVTGGHGLTIAVDRTVQWPFRWYFREFPDFTVVNEGPAWAAVAPEAPPQVVIAPDDAGMAEAGYTPRSVEYLNGVPEGYTAPDVGDILSGFLPTDWIDSVHFLLYREVTPEDARTVALGLDAELAARVYPNTGPFSLLDRPGPGSGRGQFNGPRGVAVEPETQMVYVVDMGNARVERFDAAGEYVGIWGGDEASATLRLAKTQNGLGPNGITVGPDGLIYIADTWNHRILVVDQVGNFVREIGDPGTLTDIGDDPAAADSQTGLFFGPRDVAVSEDEIYVVDTGNERVQVFGKDGTFKRVWGGFGDAPDQLSEPVGIALGPDGLVYVADSHNARISVFDRQGTPVAQWPVAAWVGQRFFDPYLAFDRDGNLYATSSATGSVEVFAPDGTLTGEIRDVAGDQLQQPVGITAAPDGTLLITDKGRNAVFRYTPPPSAAGIADDLLEVTDTEASPEASPAASPAASPEASPQASPGASPGASPEARGGG